MGQRENVTIDYKALYRYTAPCLPMISHNVKYLGKAINVPITQRVVSDLFQCNFCREIIIPGNNGAHSECWARLGKFALMHENNKNVPVQSIYFTKDICIGKLSSNNSCIGYCICYCNFLRIHNEGRMFRAWTRVKFALRATSQFR